MHLENSRIKEVGIFEHVVAVQGKTYQVPHHEQLPNKQLTLELVLAKQNLEKERLENKQMKQVQKAIELLEHVVEVKKTTLAEDDKPRLVSQNLPTYALGFKSLHDSLTPKDGKKVFQGISRQSQIYINANIHHLK